MVTFPFDIIDKYYPEQSELKVLLLDHSHRVVEKALALAMKHRELKLDLRFLTEAGMLHDIGIFLTDAPAIHCHGSKPYICHGYLGANLLREDELYRHALVCERHTGAGLSLDEIVKQNLPLPHRDMLPVTLEEQLICFADKFFSKSHAQKEKTVGEARKSLARYGKEGLARFDRWCLLFL
ncbi:MAG: HD domain-containing protein [Prevotellaceae bacterium]|jgi:uncharacterized protein|nr:HD domain-containing protein [Prevotellaceae bacterium]